MLTEIKSHLQTSPTGITYLDSKEGDDIYVLLHGISSGAYSWVKQFANAKAPNRLIAWNAPGYGGSKSLDTANPIGADYAYALIEFLDSIDIDAPITLVGHSLGALQAAAFADRNPQRLKQLILVNPAQGYADSNPEKRQEVYAMRPKLLQALGTDGLARERGPNLLYHKTPFNLEVVYTVTSGITLDGLKDSSYLLANDSIAHYLPNITVPITLVYGEKDTITPPSGMFSLKERFPFLELKKVPNAGHLAYLDEPEVFDEILFK